MSRFWKSFHREALNKTTMCEGAVGCMPDGRTGRQLQLRYRDVVKRDMKAVGIDTARGLGKPRS